MRRRCCCNDPVLATCEEAEAMLNAATSLTVTIALTAGGTCSNCGALSGTYILTPITCPTIPGATWTHCFKYCFEDDVDLCPEEIDPFAPCVEAYFKCSGFGTSRFNGVISAYTAGWEMPSSGIALPAPLSSLVSGTMVPYSSTFLHCIPSGNATWTFNF